MYARVNTCKLANKKNSGGILILIYRSTGQAFSLRCPLLSNNNRRHISGSAAHPLLAASVSIYFHYPHGYCHLQLIATTI